MKERERDREGSSVYVDLCGSVWIYVDKVSNCLYLKLLLLGVNSPQAKGSVLALGRWLLRDLVCESV